MSLSYVTPSKLYVERTWVNQSMFMSSFSNRKTSGSFASVKYNIQPVVCQHFIIPAINTDWLHLFLPSIGCKLLSARYALLLFLLSMNAYTLMGYTEEQFEVHPESLQAIMRHDGTQTSDSTSARQTLVPHEREPTLVRLTSKCQCDAPGAHSSTTGRKEKQHLLWSASCSNCPTESTQLSKKTVCCIQLMNN